MPDLSRFVLATPPEVGRAVYDFLLRPAACADPDRMARPPVLQLACQRVDEIAFARGLGSAPPPIDPPGWTERIDWASPLHRLAMLPREVLKTLAWYLGLAGQHQALRRIVRRDDLRALQANGVSLDHLAFVYSLPVDATATASTASQPIVRDPPPPAESSIDPAAWPPRIARTGWALIAAAAASLPAALAWRLALKLPIDASPDDASAACIAPADPLFETVRAQVVSSWHPSFDPSLTALAAARG
jgi:hypothetical protein